MAEYKQWFSMDPSKFHIENTAQATRETRALIQELVEHSIDTADAAEAREKQMLWWTRVGVLLAAIAAVAAIASIVVTLAVR